MKEVKLTLAQAKRYKVIERTLQGRMTNQEAANALRLSVRQIQFIHPKLVEIKDKLIERK